MVGLRAIWEIRMVGDRYCLNCSVFLLKSIREADVLL